MRRVVLMTVVLLALCGCGKRTPIQPSQLTDDPGDERGAAFSPDGKWLACEFLTGETAGDIWVIDRDTRQKRRVTFAPEARNSNPAWSPDGKLIAFDSTRDGEHHVYVVDALKGEGKDAAERARALTTGAGAHRHPAWHPDGTRIAFDCDRGGRFDVYVMNADGSDRTCLTKSTSDDTHPAWSLDGKFLAFASERSGSRDIWMTNPDGSHPRRLTTDEAEEWDPHWTPGEYVLYVRKDTDTTGFYQVRRDGRGAAQVFATDRDLRDPAVSPDGGTIAFSGNPEGDYDVFTVTFETPQ